MAKRFTDVQREEMVRLYESGLTAPEVAKKLGYGSSTVYRALKAVGIVPTDLMRRGARGKANRKFTDEEEMAIGQVYKDGLALSKLANKYGCSLVTIRNVLIRQDIPRRKRGRGVRSFNKDEQKTIIELWNMGEPQASIAEKFETHQIVVSRILKLNGIEPHPRVASGERHGNWRGGKSSRDGGYESIQVKYDSPFASMRDNAGYVLEHRLVMAENLDRSLESWEFVHHVNGDKKDNRIENLQLRTGKHGKGVTHRCLDCGSMNIETVEL